MWGGGGPRFSKKRSLHKNPISFIGSPSPSNTPPSPHLQVLTSAQVVLGELSGARSVGKSGRGGQSIISQMSGEVGWASIEGSILMWVARESMLRGAGGEPEGIREEERLHQWEKEYVGPQWTFGGGSRRLLSSRAAGGGSIGEVEEEWSQRWDRRVVGGEGGGGV